MKTIIQYCLLVLLGVVLCVRSFSQESLMLLFMPDIPHSGINNPSFVSTSKTHFSVPFMGFGASMGNNAFKWDDLIKQPLDDSYIFDPSYAFNLLKATNYIYADANCQSFYLGFRLRKHYFSISSSLRMNFIMSYPDELFELLTRGNESFIGKKVNMASFGVLGNLWFENTLGYAIEYNDQLTMGLRLKLLNGLASTHLAKNQTSLYTDQILYDITLQSSFLINTSLPPVDAFELPLNPGFAVDLGISYRFSSELTAWLGLNDFGRISWKENLASYSSGDNAVFTFSGIRISDVFNTGDDLITELDMLIDTIENIFKVHESSYGFSTPLPANIHIATSYNLYKASRIGTIVYLNHFKNKIIPSLSVSYHHSFGDTFNVITALSYYKESFGNVGLGFSIKLRDFQLYMLSGNIMAPFIPNKSKNIGFQFGMNILIGEIRTAESKSEN
jgi:hypothetical protein